MASLVKLTGLLLSASHVYATYNGGIGVGPYFDSSTDGVGACPPGTDPNTASVWCCPTGTQIDLAQDSNILCCPTAADCTDALLNSGVQCADPSMTLFKNGGSLLCCPAGYFVNDERYCVNTGDHMLYTSTAQSGSLTPDGSSPTGAAGGSAAPSNSPATTTDDGSAATSTPAAGATDTGSAGTAAATAGGATTGAGIAGSQTSSAATKSTNHAIAANVDAGAGIVGALLAVGGMLLV